MCFAKIVSRDCLVRASPLRPSSLTVNHVLSPIEDRPGDFRTLNGKGVSIRERIISTGAKFSKKVTAKALVPWSKIKIHEAGGKGAEEGVWVMVISRPLEGGIHAPAGVEDMQRDDVNKCVPLSMSVTR